jgi:transcriptional regulator GlxA family with amidase domain
MTNCERVLTNGGDRHIEIGLLCFQGYQATTVHGLTDLFAYANHFAGEQGLTGPAFRVRHWHHDGEAAVPECAFDSHPGLEGEAAVIIIPASQLAPLPPGAATPIRDWIWSHHDRGATIAGVCGGVFLLAESGLLEGRRATTHWMFADELALRFPGIAVDADCIVIDDGDIVTAGGVLAWANLGLALVGRFLGPNVMTTTARFMLADPMGKEQRFYSSFTPRLRHGDKSILTIQHWLQSQAAGPISVGDLARRAALGERTFLRRFVKATGMKPIEYHQQLRIARSRQMLEQASDSVDQIASAVGYMDPSGFRRIFKRVVGLSPAEYRRRFGQQSRLPVG